MTAKEALDRIKNRFGTWAINHIKEFEVLEQALTELEAIKSADDSVVLVGLVKLLHNYLFRADDLIIINNIKNYILKSQAQEEELRELKEKVNKIKEILSLNYSYQGIGFKIEKLFKEEVKSDE